jgi:hypothetical protein
VDCLFFLLILHNAETEIGKQIKEKYGLNEMEVTDEVFESDRSVVFNATTILDIHRSPFFLYSPKVATITALIVCAH